MPVGLRQVSQERALTLRALLVLLASVVVAVMSSDSSTASPARVVPVVSTPSAVVVSQGPSETAALTQVDDEPRSQEATNDGTLPYRLLAISMAGLSGLLGVLTFWYWKATTPPARRGYLPPVEDRLRDRLGSRQPIDRVMEVDVVKANEVEPSADEGPTIDFPL